jgi:hypothetical protein
MAAERRRVFRRISERAASGDQTMAFLEGEFSSPEQLLGGGQDQDQVAGFRYAPPPGNRRHTPCWAMTHSRRSDHVFGGLASTLNGGTQG